MNLFRSTRPFRIQYASNLFAAHRGWREARGALKPGAAPTLALLGNVGNTDRPAKTRNTQNLLQFCAANWEKVLWVPGPYEQASEQPLLYNAMLERNRTLLETWGIADRVYLLDQSAIEFPEAGVQVLAASGWSPYVDPHRTLPKESLEAHSLWQFSDGDYRHFDANRIKALHTEDMEWLELQLNTADLPTVILSHSVPDPNLVTGSMLTDAAARRLALDLMPTRPMRGVPNALTVAWLSGATGSCATGTAYPWRMFLGLNSYAGAPDAAPNPNYQPDQVFEWTRPARAFRFPQRTMPTQTPADLAVR